MRLDRELFSQLLTLFSILVGVGLQSQARLHPLWLPVPSAVPSSAQEGKVLPQFPQTICSSWIHEMSPSAASAYGTTRAVGVQKMPLASLTRWSWGLSHLPPSRRNHGVFSGKYQKVFSCSLFSKFFVFLCSESVWPTDSLRFVMIPLALLTWLMRMHAQAYRICPSPSPSPPDYNTGYRVREAVRTAWILYS